MWYLFVNLSEVDNLLYRAQWDQPENSHVPPLAYTIRPEDKHRRHKTSVTEIQCKIVILCQDVAHNPPVNSLKVICWVPGGVE